MAGLLATARRAVVSRVGAILPALASMASFSQNMSGYRARLVRSQLTESNLEQLCTKDLPLFQTIAEAKLRVDGRWLPSSLRLSETELEIQGAFETIHLVLYQIIDIDVPDLRVDGEQTVVLFLRDFRAVHLSMPTREVAVVLFEALVRHLPSPYTEKTGDDAGPPPVLACATATCSDRVARDFVRMGLPCSEWRLSRVNAAYALCPTYPEDLYVPSDIDDATLTAAAAFRSKQRLPALTYLHANGAALCRSAQPKTGFFSRSSDDERLLSAIFTRRSQGAIGHIIDARPQWNAIANTLNGGGYESSNRYVVNLTFCNIANIHAVSNSLFKLLDACYTYPGCIDTEHHTANDCCPKWQAAAAESGWVGHLQGILHSAGFIATCLANQETVLVHCSDGWDRSAQLVALAQVLVDDHYRTLDGLMTLIEKDWISFGHQFARRHALSGLDTQQSFVFTQFIDCLWQLTRWFPTAFEFNEQALLAIHAAALTGSHGNFLANSERERRQRDLHAHRACLWAALSAARDTFHNPQYVRTADALSLPPEPALRLWPQLYAPSFPGPAPMLSTTHPCPAPAAETPSEPCEARAAV